VILRRRNLRLGNQKNSFLIKLISCLLALAILAPQSAIADAPDSITFVGLTFDSEGLGTVTFEVGSFNDLDDPETTQPGYADVYLYDDAYNIVGQCDYPFVVYQFSQASCNARFNTPLIGEFVRAMVYLYNNKGEPALNFGESDLVAPTFPSCPLDSRTIQNGSFENWNYPFGYSWIADGNSDSRRPDCFKVFWKSTSGSELEIWRTPGPAIPQSTPAGQQYAELNARVFGGLYQDVTTVPGTTMRWKLKHAGRDYGLNSMKVLIGTPGTNDDTTLYLASDGAPHTIPGTFPTATGEMATRQGGSTPTTEISDDSTWGTWSGVYTVPAGQTVTRFLFISYSPNGGSEGNLLDDISFEPTLANNDSATIDDSSVGGYFDVSVNDFPRNQSGGVNGTFSAYGSLWPGGISINSATGVVTVNQGVPAGTYNLQYLLTNGTYPTDTSIGNITLTVQGTVNPCEEVDTQFSSLYACPASLTVVAGRSATINPFDINNDLNQAGRDSEDSFGGADATVAATPIASGGVAARTSGRNNNNQLVPNRAILYQAPPDPGLYTIEYTITNPDGDFSDSVYTVTVVPDTRSRAPREVPLDPRTVSYNLKLNQVTSATTNVLACIQQSNSGGSVISGTLRFDIHSSGSPDSTATYGGSTVTFTNDQSNYLRVSGPKNSVNLALETLRISRTDTPARLSSIFYIRFSSVVTGLTLYTKTDCSDSNSSQIRVSKLRPIKLTQVRTFTTVPENGRQNN